MIGRTKKKGEKILSNFRQNQQCSLYQVGRLRGDNKNSSFSCFKMKK
jgi:hypothetical protein